MPAISVILPVYNSEKYLPQTLDCLLKQTFSDFELIAVNDSSPDNAAAILEQAARKDPRVKVLNRPNGGQSAARNTGLDAATGDFILFCDDDDLMSPNAFEMMMSLQKQTDADLVCHGYKRIGPETTVADLPASRDVEGLKTVKGFSFLRRKTVNIMPWSKLYRRSLFDAIRFPELPLGEDFYSSFMTLHAAKKAVCVKNKLYFHRCHPTQQSRCPNEAKIRAVFEVARRLSDFFDKNPTTNADKRDFARYAACSQLYSLLTPVFEANDDALMQVWKDAWTTLTRNSFISEKDLSFGRRFVVNALLAGDAEKAKKRFAFIKKCRI